MSLAEKVQDLEIFKGILSKIEKDSHLNHEKLAFHDDILFFAFDNLVRCGSLSSPSYKLLGIKELDFVPKGIKLNSLGTLLAIYDEKNIIISTIPSKSVILNSDSNEISVKSFKIGLNIFKQCTILKILWDKLSKFESSLVILSNDDIIRVFDPAFSINTPKATFELNNSSNQIGLVTNNISEAVSMTFGSNDTLTGLLTLYILNKDGDIFSIYPFTNDNIVAKASSVEDLLNETILLSDIYIENFENPKRQHVVEQLKFVTDLWNQKSSATTEFKNGQDFLVLDTSKYSSFEIQGPFSIQPYPKEFYDDFGYDLISFKSGDLDLLVTSFESGGYLILAQDPEIIMKWNHELIAENYVLLDSLNIDPTLSTIYHQSSKLNTPAYLKNNEQHSKIFSESFNTISEINLNSWNDILNSESQDIDEAEVSNLKPEIIALYTLKPKESIYFVGIINNITLILTNQSVKVIQNKIENKKDSIKELEELENEINNLTLTQPKAIEPSKLNSPYSEINKLLSEATKSFSTIKSTKTPLNGDENSLRDLDFSNNQILEQVIKLHKISLSLNHRLSLQRREQARQVEILNNSKSTMDLVKSKHSDNETQFESIKKRQQLINERFDKLLKKSTFNGSLPISVKEKQWFKELKNSTLMFNSSLKKTEHIKEQLNTIKNEITSKDFNQQDTNEDWDELEKILENGKVKLSSTTKGLNDDLAKLEDEVDKIRL